MTGQPAHPFHTKIAHPARVYDYILNGKDNYAADRETAEKWVKTEHGAVFSVQANRAFLGRAVTYLAAERDVGQFLDLGAGMPAPGSTHLVAQKTAPGSRTVYVDFDPIVLAHLRMPLDEDQLTVAVEADLRDPGTVIAEAGKHLDLSEPVALILTSVLHFIPDADDPAGLVAAYRDAVAAGSYLVLSHGTTFDDPDITAAVTSVFVGSQMPMVLRPLQALEEFFGGFRLEPPGLIHPARWRPEHMTEPGTGMLAGVARKLARSRRRPPV